MSSVAEICKSPFGWIRIKKIKNEVSRKHVTRVEPRVESTSRNKRKTGGYASVPREDTRRKLQTVSGAPSTSVRSTQLMGIFHIGYRIFDLFINKEKRERGKFGSQIRAPSCRDLQVIEPIGIVHTVHIDQLSLRQSTKTSPRICTLSGFSIQKRGGC